jgi:hypothetical protein
MNGFWTLVFVPLNFRFCTLSFGLETLSFEMAHPNDYQLALSAYCPLLSDS